MTTLEEALKAQTLVTHLFLAGDSKMGKSDYVAQAAKAGFTVIYVDKDNGISTLAHLLRDDPAAMQRIIYFAPERMSQFIEGIMTESIYRHNKRTNERMTFTGLQDDDEILEIIPSRIPRQVIFSIDSWTALANDIISDKAKRLNIDLLDADKYNREIYGSVGHRATQLALLLQNAPFHVIVQGHPDVFEVKERPPGVLGTVKENDMIIKETIQIPVSTSKPHGRTLGKYFNQFGWLEVDRVGRRVLDFTVKKGRIGGGTPGGVGDPRSEYSFAKLFGRNDIAAPLDPEKPWMRLTTGAAMKEMTAKKPSPALASGAQQSTPIPPKPTGFKLPGR